MSGTSDQAARPGEKRVVMVAAVADNGVIGAAGRIPWRIPGEQKHFRAVTSGHTVVMGRRTYESIGRPLPDRTNVVVTRRTDWSAPGVHVAHTVEDAVALARDLPGDVMVIGGAEVYAAALRLADEQILTEVHASPEGDTCYPDFDRAEWVEARREAREGYDVVWWARSPVSADA